MRIVVKSKEGPNIWLPIPSCLILNRFAAGWVAKGLEDQGMHITKQQAEIFIKELNRYRRKHRDWVMVEVNSAQGDYVKVKL